MPRSENERVASPRDLHARWGWVFDRVQDLTRCSGGLRRFSQDLITALLQKDPKLRATARQALANPWMQEADAIELRSGERQRVYL